MLSGGVFFMESNGEVRREPQGPGFLKNSDN